MWSDKLRITITVCITVVCLALVGLIVFAIKKQTAQDTILKQKRIAACQLAAPDQVTLCLKVNR